MRRDDEGYVYGCDHTDKYMLCKTTIMYILDVLYRKRDDGDHVYAIILIIILA